jgi:6-phosphogluconate dehydrogenase
MSCDIGLYGFGRHGPERLNMADHGFSVCVGSRSTRRWNDGGTRAKEEAICL